MAVGRSISLWMGTQGPVWAPSPVSTNHRLLTLARIHRAIVREEKKRRERERERKGKNRSRLGLLRDDDAFESLARFDGRSKFGLRRSSVSSTLRGSEIVLSYRMVKGKTTYVIFVVQSQEERKVSRGCVTFNSST